MSYIYEALKRAEEEHRRGAVAVRGGVRRTVFGERPRWWVWTLLGVLGANVVVLGVLIFTLGTRSPAAGPSASAPGEANVTAPAPATPAAATPAPPASVAAARITEPAEPPRPIAADPPAARVGREKRAEPPTKVEPPRAAQTRDAAPPIASRAEPQAPASAVPPRAKPREEVAEAAAPVPPPQIALQVIVYSDVPSQRMAFIDGRRYAEGDALDAETVLERINPEAAVVRRRGVRFVIDARRN